MAVSINPKAVLRNFRNLASPFGSALIGFLQSGTGAVARTAQDKMRDVVSVFDFMTSAEIADVVAGTLLVNVTDALRAASSYIQTLGGGTLLFPPGKYLVGQQTFQGTLLDGVTPCAYGPEEIVTIKNCPRSVRISGYGAVLKAASGLKYGSFDPVTGAAYTPPGGGFYDYSYYSYPYRGMINVEGNASVLIEGFELDGNSASLSLGGYFGDSAYQVEAHGIWNRNNASITIRDVYAHHHGSDGCATSQTGLTESSLAKPFYMENVRLNYNGRLGLALTGGMCCKFVNCDFSMTGQVTNTGTGSKLQSTPGCGVDVEAEGTLVRDVTFENCRFLGNWRRGVIAASGYSRNVTFRDSTIENAVISRFRYHFTNCTLIGHTDFGLPATNEYLAGTPAITEEDGFRFDKCRFLYDNSLSGTGTMIDSTQSTWTEALYSKWTDCYINTGTVVLPATFRTPLAATSMVWDNCVWKSSNTGTHGITGYFRGANRVTLSGGGATLVTSFIATGGTASQIDYGWVTLNGTAQGIRTYAASNVTTDRAYDADTAVVTETNDVLGTLIADLRARNIVA